MWNDTWISMNSRQWFYLICFGTYQITVITHWIWSESYTWLQHKLKQKVWQTLKRNKMQDNCWLRFLLPKTRPWKGKPWNILYITCFLLISVLWVVVFAVSFSSCMWCICDICAHVCCSKCHVCSLRESLHWTWN